MEEGHSLLLFFVVAQIFFLSQFLSLQSLSISNLTRLSSKVHIYSLMRILELSSASSPVTDPPPADSPPPPNASPPPPVRRTPPPPRRSSNSTKSGAPPPDDSWSGYLQSQAESASYAWESQKSNQIYHGKAIVGAVVGVGLFFIVIVTICLCWRRKKRSNRNDPKQIYPEKPHNSGTNYYNKGLVTDWGNAASYGSTESKKKYPPPPPSAPLSSEHWTPAPPPPPPMMSGEMSMSFSGFARPLSSSSAPPPQPAAAWGGYDKSTFTFNQLAAATNGFSQANLLGQGGFGYVHKGVLANGQEVAVKSLKLNSGQGEREFQAEVDIISRVHHRHLVALVGYCISGSRRMLVYEYVPNSTLEEHLHGTSRPCLDFPTRLKIALGAAKGFAYLHEDCHPRIIHRDIKAANILLDNNNEAKVADFGLAKLSSDNNTHVSTRIMGTFGYLAPEYASSGKLTERSDVYSFGIVLLELITGRRPVDLSREDEDDTHLVDWTRPILTRVAEGGSYQEMVDPRLENNYDHGQMLRMLSSAAACVRQSSRKRPKMSQIVRNLEGDVSLDDLHEGMRASHGSLSASSSEYDLQKYQNFTSSELGDASDYAHSQASGTNSNELTRPSPDDRAADNSKSRVIFHL